MNNKIKNVALFNKGREPAHSPHSVVSNTIPTLSKPSQTKVESIKEFQIRSGEVTLCKPKLAPKRRRTQIKATRDQMLSVVRGAPPKTSSAPNTIAICCSNVLTIVPQVIDNDDLNIAA